MGQPHPRDDAGPRLSEPAGSLTYTRTVIDPAEPRALRASRAFLVLHGARILAQRRTLLASYPRDRLLTRAFSWLENLGFRLVGKRFRSYVHPPAELEEAAAGRGLTRSRVSRGLVWETAQYDAPSA